jgi:glycosyltransferase involved in cell wall biosynthesis
MRVLIVAPTCDQSDVAEALYGFRWVSGLSEIHDVTLVTYHKRGAPSARSQFSNVRVIEWTEPPLVGKFTQLNNMMKPGYFPFFFRARRWIKTALRNGEHFDVAFQPVPIAMRYPSPLVGCGIPFIIGPLAGSIASPAAFVSEENESTQWFVKLRQVDDWRLNHDRSLRASLEQAQCVLGAGRYVQERLTGLKIQRFEVLPDTGTEIPPTFAEHSADTSGTSPIRLLFVGRIIRTKGVRDLIRSLADLADLDLHLDIVGDGVDRPACESIVSQLGLSSRVTFHGRVSRSEVDKFYRSASMFVFPSYREPGGNAVAEAMSFGLPVITCNRGGVADKVDDTNGILVSATTPEQLKTDVAAAIRQLADSPETRRKMGLAGREKAISTETWESKIARVSQLFLEIVEDR